MKKTVAMLIAAALICTLSVPGFAAYKEEYKLDIVPSLTTAWGMGAQYFTDLVKERSGGKINIKVYPGSQLTTGKQTNTFLLVRNGTIDFAVQSSINYSPQIVELNLFALPFFIANQPDRYAAMDAIKAGKSGAMVIKAVEDKGVKFLAWGENGFRELTNSKREIRSPQDMEGMKISVVYSPIFLDAFRAIGANAMTMNCSDTMAAIQQVTGVIAVDMISLTRDATTATAASSVASVQTTDRMAVTKAASKGSRLGVKDLTAQGRAGRGVTMTLQRDKAQGGKGGADGQTAGKQMIMPTPHKRGALTGRAAAGAEPPAVLPAKRATFDTETRSINLAELLLLNPAGVVLQEMTA
mgnify:CR=1 FL=1